jgi:hypothetical protein
VRLALWLDRQDSVSEQSKDFGPALRLFDLDRFRDGQLPVVQAALRGRSLPVVSPTGFGKTLCFQMPAVLRLRGQCGRLPAKSAHGRTARRPSITSINPNIPITASKASSPQLDTPAANLALSLGRTFLVRRRCGNRCHHKRAGDLTSIYCTAFRNRFLRQFG